MFNLLGLVLGAVLTLFILSYVVGDNPLYRLALHLFIGILVGYSFGIVLRDVVMEMALSGLLSKRLSVVAPIVLGVLLLFKGYPRQAYVGNVSMGYLIGVGAAVAMGGALLGTLAPQIAATGRALGSTSLENLRFGIIDGLMIVVGTISTLVSFTFVRPTGWRRWDLWERVMSRVTQVGRVFLILALAVGFAGALTTSLSILIGRAQYLIDVFSRLTGG